MKTKFVTIALIAISCITTQLFAQEAAAKTTGYDLKKNVKGLVSSTETGYSIAFEYDVKSPRDATSGMATGKRGYDYYQSKSEFSVSASDNSVTEVISPRDAASGLSTGKRQHKPISVTKEIDKSSPKLAESVSSGTVNSVHEVISPRDAASGLPTGKRQHKPVTVTKELDKSSPKLAESVSSSEVSTDRATAIGSITGGGAAGKAVFKEFTITKRCDVASTTYAVIDGVCEIPTDDCPNGVCTLTANWSWGANNASSTGVNPNSAVFYLKIEDGACTAMAINEKGLVQENRNLKKIKVMTQDKQ